VAEDEQPAADDAAAPEPDAPDAPDTADVAATEPDAAEPAEPDTADEAEDEDEAAEAEGPADRWRLGRAPLLLGVASVLLAGFAILAAVQAHGKQADRNVALTDASATSQVRQQVSAAINTIFSYNYADTGTTRAAAQRLLTGPAVRQYDSLFRLVQQEAPEQHLVLTTKVTNVGVELLIGDRARLLIFADQRDTRQKTQQTSYAGAMFAVNAVRQNGRWKIESIDTFTGSS
jgi:Mce-associated membrane protein